MRYAISGGSGFLGQELVKRLFKRDPNCFIRVFARGEGNLVALKEKYPKVEILVGDVADSFTCEKALKDIDGVFHLAALKHVGLAEVNVRETINSNIPLALLEATRKYKPKFIIGVSTDKATSRKGVYGSTKFLMERLFSEYEKLNPDTQYRIVRYGNVLYSTGSVLCKWKNNLLEGKDVIITEPKATRFFWTIEQAVDLIFECLNKATDSQPYVTKMKSINMGDLLEVMKLKYGNEDIITHVIGLQPGENLHEIITENGLDSSESEKFTKEEIFELI